MAVTRNEHRRLGRRWQCGLTACFVLFALVGAGGAGATFDRSGGRDASGERHRVLHGFTGFPYDLTQEALDRVHDLAVRSGNLYAVHNDGDCVPWREMLAGSPGPAWLEDSWRQIRASVPATEVLYAAITPTQADRVTMGLQCGISEGATTALPQELQGARYDDPAVKRAYLAYARRVVEILRPRYLTLAIEISELSLQRPDLWPQLQALYLGTVEGLRQSHPGVDVGIELVLQTLLVPRVADQVRPAVEAGDYMCISFYPYGSAFGELFGAPALPTPPDQWRKPLQWLRSYTAKPVAVCEAGYTTKTRVVQGIPFPGNQTLQRRFLRDLIAEARREQYLFVVWFIAIDYERLQRALGAGPDHAGWIWANTGLFDSRLRPKPAWAEWRRWDK
jgi:hypothetical protein